MGEEVPSLEMKLKVGAVFFWYNSNDLNGDEGMKVLMQGHQRDEGWIG